MNVAGEFEIIKYHAVWDEAQQKFVPGEEIERRTERNKVRARYMNQLRTDGGMFPTTFEVTISRARLKTEGEYNSVGDSWFGTQIQNGTYTNRDPLDPRETAITLGYWTWRTRFDPPSSGFREIAAISLRTSTENDNNGFNTLAGVGLTEICIQTDVEIIDVFYRLYVDDETVSANTVSSTTDVAAYRQALDIILSDSTPTSQCYYAPSRVGFDWWPSGLDIDGYGTNPPLQNTTAWNLTVGDTANEKYDGVRDEYIALASVDYIGFFMGSGTVYGAGKDEGDSAGQSGNSLYAVNRTSNSWTVPPGTSKVQSTFGKLLTSNLPYLDIDNQATGTGSLTIAETTPGESWAAADHLFAETYRILITTSGDVGTAEYRLAKAMWTPSGGSTYSSSGVTAVPNLPHFRHHARLGRQYVVGTDGFGDPIRHGVHGPDDYIAPVSSFMAEDMPFVMSYAWPEFLSVGKSYGDPYDSTKDDVMGLTIYDMKCRVLNVNKFTFPAFVVTDIRQVVTEDDGTIWVACSDTGLWKITRATTGSPAVIDDLSNGTACISSITRITTTTGVADNTACRGVQLEQTAGVAAAGATLWAVFDKEMCKSSDSGATWTVYNAGSSPPFVITGVTGGGDDASGIMHFVKDHEHATKERFFLAVRAAAATTDGQGYWWSTDATDTVSGIATFVDVDATLTGTATYITNKIIGARCIYAGSDGDWYFAYSTNSTGIARYAFNGTNDLAFNISTSISTRTGSGIQVYFDENGDDWIVGYDHTNASDERVRGKRPANATSTSTAGSKVLCWRIQNSTSTLYDNWLSGLSAYVGNGIWLSFQIGINYSQFASTSTMMWSFIRFFEDNRGGMDTSGTVTDDKVWTEYGWEGSPGQWVEGSTSPKVTHSTTEDLIDGLEIDFTGGSGGAFDDGDMYDTYLFDGIIKDNATTTAHTFYTFMYGNVAGTDFLSSTVPAAPVGAVTNEALVPQYVGSSSAGYLGSNPGEMFPMLWGNSSSSAFYWQTTNVFAGDFTIEFCMNNCYMGHTSYDTRFGLMDVSLADTDNNNFVGGWCRIDSDTTVPSSATRRYSVGNSTNSTTDGFYDMVTQKTNSAADDYFLKDQTVRVQRVGTTITWSVKFPNGSYNQIHQYTSISNTLVFGGVAWGYNNLTYFNARCSYTPNTYHTWVGNGTTTGPGTCVGTIDADDTTLNTSAWPDPNFRAMPRLLGTTNFLIEVDTTGSGNWVERSLTGDPYDTLANTEVRVLRNGKIEFHADDAGRNFRGRWMYGQRQNLV